LLLINIASNDFKVKNISLSDLVDVLNFINEDSDNLLSIGYDKKINLEFIKEKYMESLVDPLEFFCGIYKEDEMLGILKGRLENKGVLEVWFLTYILKKSFRRLGLGSYILKLVEDYLKFQYNVLKYYAIVSIDNEKSIKFWIKNGYIIERTSEYFKLNDKPVNILMKGVK